MKTMTAAMAVAGCAAAWSACVGQPVDDAMHQTWLISGNDADTDDGVRLGLLGSYPDRREASGTGWQPDSTLDDDSHRAESRVPGTGMLVSRRNNGFSLLGRENDTVLITRGALGAGTVGLQSTVSIDPFVTSAAFSAGPPGRDSVWVGGDLTNSIRYLGLAASYSYPVGTNSAIFGYFGAPGEPALGPPVSYMRRLSGIDTPEVTRASHWLDSTGSGSRVFTLGYTWRELRLEGSAFSGREQDSQKQVEKNSFKLDSTSTRLSYNPSPNWSLQFSRGTLSGLDQLEPNEDIRRTTISATYNRALGDGNWQTTLAWGRNARKSREPTMGYLLESTLRFSGTHAVFGRLEQVGSDEMVRQNESIQGQMFKLNRLTIGYFHDVTTRGPVKFDVGVFANRYFVPSSSTASYGSEPTSFMLFVRLKLQ